MANISYVDGKGVQRFFKASGTGTEADPQIVEHKQPETVTAINSVKDSVATELTLKAIRDRFPATLGSVGGLKVEVVAGGNTSGSGGGSSLPAKAADPAQASNYQAGDAVSLLVDKSSGALLTYGRKLTATDDEITVNSKKASDSTVNPVPASVSNTILLTAKTNRRAAFVFNDSSSILYLKLATNAAQNSFTRKVAAQEFVEIPANYSGIVTGVWATADGSALITEILES